VKSAASHCIESHVSKLRSENSALLDRIARQDAEITRLQNQLTAVTEERDSLSTKVSQLFIAFCVLIYPYNIYCDNITTFSDYHSHTKLKLRAHLSC